MRRTFSILLILVAAALSVSAQSETDLKNYFQGKAVTVRIDMPSGGVNIYPERSQSLDYKEYNQRLANDRIEIQRGHAAILSDVRVKGNQIEARLSEQDRTSRFNIRFTRIESWMLTPAGLIDALNRYVEFSEADKKAARLQEPTGVAAGYVRNGVVLLGPRQTYLHSGLKTSEVLKLLGEPSSVSERTVNGKIVATFEFQRGEGRVVIAEFVGGALIGSRTELRTVGPVALVLEKKAPVSQ